MSKYVQKLKNPKTESYREIKNFILSPKFSWYWYTNSTTNNLLYDKTNYENVPFYSHAFLSRPEGDLEKIPKINSDYTGMVSKVLLEILQLNDIEIMTFLRINANAIHPTKRVVNTVPHVDHYCAHKNLILYLTDAGGKTIIGDDSFNPNEDDVIVFDGTKYHHLQTPKDKRRVVVVATFI